MVHLVLRVGRRVDDLFTSMVGINSKAGLAYLQHGTTWKLAEEVAGNAFPCSTRVRGLLPPLFSSSCSLLLVVWDCLHESTGSCYPVFLGGGHSSKTCWLIVIRSWQFLYTLIVNHVCLHGWRQVLIRCLVVFPEKHSGPGENNAVT